jgi:hypothetical protein
MATDSTKSSSYATGRERGRGVARYRETSGKREREKEK